MSSPAFLLQVLPARASSARGLPALETAMQSLALDVRSPLALELAATAATSQFLLRADDQLTIGHLRRQIQARYLQAVIAPATADPLMLAPGEECSVQELRPGAASYLPLRTWKGRDLLEEGTDPLLGILAAFGDLPQDVRAVAQLALLPASPTWSKAWRRRAVEHPLEQERARARLGASTQAPEPGRIVALFVLVVLLALIFRFRQSLSRLPPPWLLEAGDALFHGKGVHLTPSHMAALTAFGVVLLLVAFALLYGSGLVLGRLRQTALYDQRLVDEKTARPAYRVRLRLFVFSPGEPWPALRTRPALFQHPSPWGARYHRHALITWAPMQKSIARWKRWAKRGRRPFFRAAWHREQARFRGWRRRVVAARARRAAREDVLRVLAASYRQYHLAAGGYFVPRRLSARRVYPLLLPSGKRLFHRVGWAADLPRSAHFLSVADLAALWHLPQAHDLTELPYVEQEHARTLLAPTLLSTGKGYPLGISTHAGQTLPVFLPFGCLWQNMLIAASTGKGKSNLLEHLTRAFALARMTGDPAGEGGALLVDPHGDQVEHVSGNLPAILVDDIVLIRLADREYPIGFNPLDMSQGQDRDKIIDNLIQVVEALWPTSYGPRTENFLEYGCKTLAEANLSLLANNPINGPDQQFTLLDVVHLFRQEVFRHAVFDLVQDKHILNWWNDYYEQLDGRQQAEFTSSLVTKMSKFASSRISRRILGQARSSLNFTDLIRQKKLVLLSCAAGDVGADLAALFGSLLLGFFQTALAEQARLNPGERHRFLVLIDEFQTLKVDYQTMLAELRKYGGSFALATQSLAYLDRFERTLRATVLANINHTFAFALSAEDARLLRLPGIEPDDVIQLPDYTCYARLSLNGQRLPTFSMRLHAPDVPSEERQQDIVNRCRARYGRPVGVVDQGLLESEARRHTMRPARARRGAKGYEVVWSGTGEERVREVLSDGRHHGGRGGGKGTHEKEEEASILPQHVMYAQQEIASEDFRAHEQEEGMTDVTE
ncbi:MAG TPA: TraM recognition domain-containing protein [Ktedonobacteraceae bacterium]|nr:TraM recognition domain-containing protein [Ktedonobacteraceae bacterium]